jgi:putative transposase
MILHKNMLIQWTVGDKKRLERVLWIDPLGVYVATIDLQQNDTVPILQKYREILTALENADARLLEDDNDYTFLYQPEESIDYKYRQRRDERWEKIKELVERTDGAMFDRKTRGPLIAAIARKYGFYEKTIYRVLQLYWCGGQVKNSLLPHWNKSGGKGKDKRCGSSKRGRPNAESKETGQSIGINVTPEIRQLFVRGIKKFYEKEPNNSLGDAYQLTLETYFSKGIRLEQGIEIPELPDANELPTIDQFKYWYYPTSVTVGIE